VASGARRAACVLEPLLAAGLAIGLARVDGARAALPALGLLDGPLGTALALLAVAIAAVRAVRPRAPQAPAAGARLARLGAADLPLTAASFALVAGVGLFYAGRLQAAGDEPHYLLMAQSLWNEGDLDLRDNYARQDYLDYNPGPLEPHYAAPRRDGRPYPAHSPGLSLALAPLYALGGRSLCVVALALAAALAAREAALLAAVLAGPRAALFARLTALGPPLFLYGFHVYTEAPAALALAFALRRAVLGGSASSAIAAALAAAALPWLHVKLGLAAVGVGVAAVIGLRGRPRLAFVGTAGPAVLVFVAYYLYVFGRPTPFAIYGGVPADVLTSSPLAAALGLWLDRSFGLLPAAPVYLLLLALAAGGPRIAAADSDSRPAARRLILALAGLVLCVLLPAVFWRMWWGGMCPPARFVVPAVPLLAAAVGALVAGEPARGLARWRWSLLGLSWALAAFMVARPVDRLLLNRGDRPTRVWDALAAGEATLGRYLPSLVSADAAEWRVAVMWLAMLGLLALLQQAAQRSERIDAAFRTLSLPLGLFLALAALADLIS
jgi:hypothetical protein